MNWGKAVTTTSSGKAGVPVPFKVRVGDLVYLIIVSGRYKTMAGGPIAVRVISFNRPYDFSRITLVRKSNSLVGSNNAVVQRRLQSNNELDPFQKGKAALAAQRFQEAVVHFLKSCEVRKAIYERTPSKFKATGYAAANRELGITYIAINKWKDAYERLQEALRVDPNDLETKFMFGIVAMTVGDLPKAELVFRELASSKKPEFARPVGAMFVSEIYRLYGKLEESSRFDKDFVEQASKQQVSANREIADLFKIIIEVTSDVEKDAKIRETVRLILSQALIILHKANVAITEKKKGSYSLQLVQPLHDLASVLQMRERYDEAERLMNRSLSVQKRLLGSDHVWMAMSLERLADFEMERERFSEAERHYKEAAEIYERSLGRDNTWVDMMDGDLARLYQKQHRFQEAETRWQDIKKRHCSHDVNRMPCLTVLMKLSEFYSDQKNYPGAIAEGRQALELAKRLWAARDPIGTRIILEMLDDLEDLYQSLNQQKEIEAVHREKQEILNLGVEPVPEEVYEVKLSPTEPLPVTEAMAVGLNGSRCSFTRPNGFVDYPKSKRLLEAAGRLARHLDSRDPDVAELMFALGSIYYWENRLDQAERLVTQAINSNEAGLESNRRTTAILLSLRGNIKAESSDLRGAEADYSQGAKILEILDRNSEDIPILLFSLSKLQIAQQKYDDAEKNLKRALDMRESTEISCSEPDSVTIITELAVLYVLTGRLAEAENNFKRALNAIGNGLLAHPNSVYILKNYARCLRQLGRIDEATRLELDAQRINPKKY